MTLLIHAAEVALRLYSCVAPTERGGYRLARLVRHCRPRGDWRGVFETPDHFRIDLDLGTYPDCCMAYGLYELDTVRLIKKLLKPGDHFVDGGANIGYITMLAAKRVGPHGRVDAFEPEPENRRRLHNNLAHNGLADSVHVYPQALSDKPGRATISFPIGDGFNHGSSSLFGTRSDEARQTVVETVRMDQALSGTNPRLIKLDLEGAEPLAISGMAGMLQTEQPPMLIVEYNPSQARAASYHSTEFVDRVLTLQPAYRLYAIGARLRPLDHARGDVANLRQGNLFFRAS